MYLRRHLLLCFLAISVFFVGLCSTLHAGNPLVPIVRAPKNPTLRDQQRFQELLDGVDSSSLHEVLHEKIDKYKHGVFQEDKSAIAVVHQQAPEVASSLIELAKRQAPTNGSTLVPPVTSTTAITTEATSTFVTPITSSIITTEIIQSSEGSSSVLVTEESTVLSTSQSTIVSTSIGVTSSEVVISLGSGTTATSTVKDTGGSPSGSRSTSPSPSSTASVTSFNIFTTTLPNGKPTTITQTTVVPAGQPDQTAVDGVSTKTNPAGSLQTNGASKMKTSANGILGMIVILLIGAS